MGKQEKQVLDEILVKKLVNTIENRRNLLIVKIFVESGCKTHELASIKLKDIKNEKGIINSREVVLSKELCSEIKEFAITNEISQEDFIFSSRQSSKITTKRIRQIVQSQTKESLGFQISPEQIRKFSLKQKLKKYDVETVKNQAGLKRLDSRKYISKEQISKLESSIKDKRKLLIFSLLLKGLKSHQIAQLKVRDIEKLNLRKNLAKTLYNFSTKKSLTNEDPLFISRQSTILTNERIFQIITKIGEEAGIRVSPRILNNTALASAVASSRASELEKVGVKTKAFHLHGGFYYA